MLLFTASAVIFIYGMLASLLGTIVPSLGLRLALSNVQIGYLALAQGLGLAVTSVCAGALTDRHGKKAGIVIGLCASIVGLLTLAHAGTLAIALAAMAILGCGGSLVIVGSNAIAADVPDARKGTTLNILNLFVGLGGLVTPFLAGNLLGSDAAKVAYVGMGVSVLALILTLSTPMRTSARVDSGSRDGTVFRDSMLYMLSAVTFLYTACEFAMWNWLPKYLISTGMPGATALNILSLGFACGMLIGRLVAARVLIKAAPLPVTLFAALSMGIASFLMLSIGGTFAVASVVFLVGLAMAPVFPTVIALVSRHFKQRAATAIGFAITCGFSGLVVSSPVIGWLSGSGASGLRRGLMVIPVLSFVMVAILLFLRPRLLRDAEAALSV